MMDLARTIVAISSGVAPARRCVIRLSGPDTRRILDSLLVDASDYLKASVATQFTATAEIPIASARQPIELSVYYWPDERSFTGQTSAELHLLGSLPIVECLTEHLIAQGASLAERGEFTLRSFLAGKLDLPQAEAVLGVIEANTEAEMQIALAQLAGGLSEPVRELRRKLVELTAHLEAGLDFVEEDIEFISTEELVSQLQEIQHEITSISSQLKSRGTRSRIPTVVLTGLPNAGKSTLFNTLCGHQRAIVSDRAGTTRDALSASVMLSHDNEIELIDTAGIEELSNQTPRALAQTILKSRLSSADAILFCFDLTISDQLHWAKQQTATLNSMAPTLVVGTKSDLLRNCDPAQNDAPATNSKQREHSVDFDLQIDANDAGCVRQIQRALRDILAENNVHRHAGAIHHTMIRCRESLEKAVSHIQQAILNAESMAGEEFVATDLRSAIHDLSAVIGEVHNEDILDQIFSRFCIGK